MRTQKQVKHVVEAAEVMHGYQPGISSAWGASEAPMKVTQQIVGNAFHASFVQSMPRNWQPSYFEERTRRIMAMTKEDMEDEMLAGIQTPLERNLKQMSDAQLSDWMDEKLMEYQDLQLSTDVKGGEAPAQFPPRMRYQTPQKWHEPVMAAIREKLGVRLLKLVRYNVHWWVSPMFVKPKGRQDLLTGLELLRFLTDFRAVNAGLQWNAH